MRVRVWLLAVLVVGACSQPVTGEGEVVSEHDGIAVGNSPGTAEPDEPPADVLTVSCRQGAIRVGAARVRTKADGLHLHVLALPHDGTSVEVSNSRQGIDGRLLGGLGGASSLGVTVIATVAPGEILVRCYPDEGPRHFQSADEDAQAVTVEVVDQANHWRELPRSGCDAMGVAIYDHFTKPNPGDGPPTIALEEVAASDLNQPREIIRTFGYENADIRWAGVIRANRLTTFGSYQRHGDSWRLKSTTSCDQP